MKKNRIFSLLLALFMLGSCIIACSESPSEETGPETSPSETADPTVSGETETETETEIEVETEESILNTLPEFSFNGDTITALCRDDVWWSITTLAAEEITGEIINDATFNRNAAFMEKYNVDFKPVNDPSDFMVVVRNAVSAGDGTYDFVVPRLMSAASMVNEDLIMNLNDMPTVDFTNAAWDQNAVKYFSIEGKLYYGVSDITLGKNECAWIYMFNKRLLDDYGLEDPYTLVREGKWTFDVSHKFMETATNDANGNGIVDTGDRFGLATHNANFYALLISAGQPVAVKDETLDIPVMNAGNEAFVNVYDTIMKLFTDKSQTVMEYAGETFVAGDALLCGQVIACVRLFREMEDDFGIIPCPKYDEAQSDYYTYMLSSELFVSVIPVSASNPQNSGIALQALSILSMEYLTPAYYDITITGKGLRDKDSEEMLDIILDSAAYDLARVYDWRGFPSSIPNSIENQKDLASTYTRFAKAIQIQLDQTLETFRNNNH